MICGNALPPKTRSIAPKFCSGRCRQQAYRNRRRMASARRWVRAQGKRPLTISGKSASSTNPATWSSLDEVLDSRVGDGFGIMLGGGLACWDFDDCLTDGRLNRRLPHVENILLTEISISGNGLHVFVRSTAPSFKHTGVEFYSHSRFIRMTGVPFAL